MNEINRTVSPNIKPKNLYQLHHLKFISVVKLPGNSKYVNTYETKFNAV